MVPLEDLGYICIKNLVSMLDRLSFQIGHLDNLSSCFAEEQEASNGGLSVFLHQTSTFSSLPPTTVKDTPRTGFCSSSFHRCPASIPAPYGSHLLAELANLIFSTGLFRSEFLPLHKCLKICWTSLAIREMRTKTTVR